MAVSEAGKVLNLVRLNIVIPTMEYAISSSILVKIVWILRALYNAQDFLSVVHKMLGWSMAQVLGNLANLEFAACGKCISIYKTGLEQQLPPSGSINLDCSIPTKDVIDGKNFKLSRPAVGTLIVWRERHW